jgi:hypothetical protein
MKRWGVALLGLLATAGALGGCAEDVALVNPRTGETAVCPASLQGVNPWSQQEACIGDHIAGGWVRAPRAEP